MIETEIERDLTQRVSASETPIDSEEVGEQLDEQDNDTILDESEDQGMSMGM